jgi:glutathione-regulated potassium-efflux system ancillary protein KefG
LFSYVDSLPAPPLSVNLRRLIYVAPTVDTDDLIDSQEVADVLGLSHRNSVSTYLRRYADFPRPVVERGGGRTRLWLRQSVAEWAASRWLLDRPE